jgi:opacity protein-like surface antigen
MKNFVALLAIPLAASASAALAQESSTHESSTFPAVKVSGFGTAALTWTDEDQAEFVRPNQSGGVRKSPRTGVDSNLGLQADMQINDWLSLTGQGLVRKDAENSYGAELAWAFAKLRLSDQLSVRVGRVGLPVFMISDYRNVGYANTLLRPPAEVYSQVPFNSADGFDVTWQRSFGDTSVTSQLAYGNNKVPVLGTLHMKGKGVTALHIVAEHGPFTLRAGYARMKLTIDDSPSLNTLLASLRAAGAGYRLPQLAPLANEIAVDDKKGTFKSVGLTMDWNNIVLQSELTRRTTETWVNDTTSWYAMGGYRFGKFLPYVSHAKLKIDGGVVNTVPTACPAGYPAVCTATVRQLGAAVARLPIAGLGQGAQETDTIGVRWDFYRSVALKAQIDRVKPTAGTGLLINAQPGFTGPVTVGAVALDFVF